MGQALGTGYLVIDKSQPQCIVLSVRSTLSSKCEPFWQKKNQDDNGFNAKLHASKWQSKNRWVM